MTPNLEDGQRQGGEDQVLCRRADLMLEDGSLELDGWELVCKPCRDQTPRCDEAELDQCQRDWFRKGNKDRFGGGV